MDGPQASTPTLQPVTSMIHEPAFNTSILVVDDEEGILEAYRNALTALSRTDEELDDMVSRRRRRSPKQQTQAGSPRQGLSYQIFTASSGEEAVEIVRQEQEAGRQVPVGFFDMAMPGGIDGPETIRRILQLDNQMLCAVVTAYTDRSPSQLGTLFSRQDDWLYFNKPFSTGELEQTAYHLVTAWNQRRREESLISNLEMMSNGLLYILQTAQDINRVPPLVLDSLLQGILSHFLRLAGAEDGFVFLPHGESPVNFGQGKFDGVDSLSTLELRKRWGLAHEIMYKKNYAVVDGNTAVAPLRIGPETLGVLFVQSEEPIKQDPKLFEIYASQAVNMIQQSRLYAEVNVRNSELSEKNQELVDLLGKLTQSESLKDQFEKLSYMDSLTAMPNRRYIETTFEQEVERARLHGDFLACLLIDIDHFKNINDTYGHLAGDYVLQEMGRIFRSLKRPSDVIGRYGGEEFIIIYKGVEPKDIKMLCERLRKSIEEHTFQFEGQDISVTASVGCAALTLAADDTMQSIVQKADTALYKAKEEGRNRTVVV